MLELLRRSFFFLVRFFLPTISLYRARNCPPICQPALLQLSPFRRAFPPVYYGFPSRFFSCPATSHDISDPGRASPCPFRSFSWICSLFRPFFSRALRQGIPFPFCRWVLNDVFLHPVLVRFFQIPFSPSVVLFPFERTGDDLAASDFTTLRRALGGLLF